jgi:membrane protein
MDRHRPRAVWEFLVALVKRFLEVRATQTAGSLAYTTLLALVPVFTVAIAIATAFPVFEEWIASLRQFIVQNVLPDTPAAKVVAEQVHSFTHNVGRLTAIGVAGFAVTSVMLMLTVDNALNRIFRVQRRRSVVQSVFIYWGLITLGPLLAGGSLSGVYFALHGPVGAVAPGLVADALARLVPLVFTCGALVLLYGVVPARPVNWRHALLGGLLAGLVFELAKRGFALYLSRVPTYTLIYGAFATIPVFLVWLYVSWLVVLGGAILTSMLPAYRAKPERHHAAGQALTDALGVLGALARAHAEGRVVSSPSLAHKLRLPPDRCEAILERAAARGWAARTEGGDGWVLARAASRIRIADVYRAFVFDAEALGAHPDLGLSLRDFLKKAEEGDGP